MEIDPEQEQLHQKLMPALGVRSAEWALCKVVEHSDVQPGQNRLLLTKTMTQGGPIPRLFPELERVDDDGRNLETEMPVKIINAEAGIEKAVVLRFLNSNKAYRIKGPEWRAFVQESGLCKGDRLDLYAGTRVGGERCLLFFRSEFKDDGTAWKRTKRSRQQDAVADAVSNGDAGGKRRRSGGDRHRRDASVRGDDDQLCMHVASTGAGFDISWNNDDWNVGKCWHSELISEEEEEDVRRLWDDATDEEKAACIGLLLLKRFAASLKEGKEFSD